MDSASKEPGYLTIRFAPEVIRSVAPQGAKAAGPVAGEKQQKSWLPSNFRLEIDGLDCSRVNRIEPLAVRANAAPGGIGDARDYAKEPGKLEFPDLKITLPEDAAKPFIDWHEDFVIKGNNGQDRERKGTLTLLSANRAETLLRIKFNNIGIYAVRPMKVEANADTVARVQVEMYMESMELVRDGAGTPPPAAASPPPAPLPKAPGPLRPPAGKR